MFHLRWTPLILLLLGGVLRADVQNPATRPARPSDAYRMLGNGSWIVSQATIRTNPGFPAQVKRKITVTTRPAGGRAAEEGTWTGTDYEVNTAPQALTPGDERSFDDLHLTPQGPGADRIQIIARQRYACVATTYTLEDAARRETTRFTLFRDKNQTTRLPPRVMTLGGQQIPLPPDAIAVDFTIEGANVSIQGQRRILLPAAPIPIGDRLCTCVMESVRTTGTRGGKPVASTAREWHCHELPGEKLKSMSTANIGTVKIESEMTVLDFHVVPLATSSSKLPTTRAVGE